MRDWEIPALATNTERGKARLDCSARLLRTIASKRYYAAAIQIREKLSLDPDQPSPLTILRLRVCQWRKERVMSWSRVQLLPARGFDPDAYYESPLHIYLLQQQ
jgi:hypothetical protein